MIEELRAELDGIATESDPASLRIKSRDFFWFSPILKPRLEGREAELIVMPANREELARVAAGCVRHRVPLTVRGGGTGNYGQAVPLAGGIVLDMTRLDRVLNVQPGMGRFEAGARLLEIDRQLRPERWELRFFPSTRKVATIGGFLAGGAGGVGSCTWGQLADPGAVLAARVLTVEEQPRLIELRGREALKVTHAYGTNGIITEVEMPLTAAYDWVDVIVGFDTFAGAASYGNALACQDGILTKEIAPIAAPVPYLYFKRHQKFLAEGQSVCVVMVAEQSLAAFLAFTRRIGGEVVFNGATVADRKGLPPAYELAWNHTTLRALRVDPSITYLQVLYPFPNQLELANRMDKMFPGEVFSHLEFVRFDGNITCFGLPLVKFTTEERLDEIMRLHEENGCPIFNAHRYTLEEGGMKQTDEIQLAFKREADPQGLLNPGKMIAWENPDYDYKSGRVFLFKGLQKAG